MQSLALKGQRREGVKKGHGKDREGCLPSETEGLGNLGHLDSQKPGVAGMCDSEENTAELVME